MAKWGITHVVISAPRLFFGAVLIGVAVGAAQFNTPSTEAQPLQPQTQHIKPIVPYTVGPQAIVPPPPVPASAAGQTPPPAAHMTVSHSNAAPVIKPAAGADVNGLAPVIPPNPSGGNTGGSSASETPPTAAGYTSTNWSGYLAAAGSYTAVSGSWTVPKATGIGRKTSADSAWIGIGGVTTSDLIQVGTEDTVSFGGVQTTRAFYELLPGAAHTITSLKILPGDTITASLGEASAGEWNITITDTTTGKSYTAAVSYGSSHSSAEWIEEDPSTSLGNLVPLDSFAPVSFSRATATVATGSITPATGNAQPVTMVASGLSVAVPSALGSDGGSFTVTHQ